MIYITLINKNLLSQLKDLPLPIDHLLQDRCRSISIEKSSFTTSSSSSI
jgi:hypothetical protein